MNIHEKYKIEETADSFSIKPHWHLINTFWYNFIGIIASGFALLVFFDELRDEIKMILGGLIFYCIFYCLYTCFFKLSIRYTFERRSNAVVKSSWLTGTKKIMRLDEVVIFESSEAGRWNFSMGAKKNHFVKSYAISEHFTSGKKSAEREKNYEDFILNKINKMIRMF